MLTKQYIRETENKFKIQIDLIRKGILNPKEK